MTDPSRRKDLLLDINDLHIEGRSGGAWHPIIKGVDLQLKRGEIMGLIGESGAGKSTLGLAAMGYTKGGCRISGGSINFDGHDLVGARREQLRKLHGARIAYVAQSAAVAFNPAYRLIDQYCEAPVRHGVMSKAQARKDAVQLYTEMQLPDPGQIGFRYPHQVSGGQLQRAMTAMAMACRPDLIIFDEPTTALDVTTRRSARYDPDKARDLMKKAGHEGTKFKLHTSETPFAGAVDGAQLFSQHAAQAGIDIEVVREPEDGYWSNVWGQAEFFASRWSGRADADLMLTLPYSRESIGSWNATHWDNEAFNTALVAARGERDDAKRKELYWECQALVSTEGGMIAPAWADYLDAKSSKISTGEKIAGDWDLDGARASERWWFNA